MPTSSPRPPDSYNTPGLLDAVLHPPASISLLHCHRHRSQIGIIIADHPSLAFPNDKQKCNKMNKIEKRVSKNQWLRSNICESSVSSTSSRPRFSFIPPLQVVVWGNESEFWSRCSLYGWKSLRAVVCSPSPSPSCTVFSIRKKRNDPGSIQKHKLSKPALFRGNHLRMNESISTTHLWFKPIQPIMLLNANIAQSHCGKSPPVILAGVSMG